jgi:hypothetical protein
MSEGTSTLILLQSSFREAVNVRKCSMTFFNACPPNLYSAYEGIFFPRAEIIEIVIPWNDKCSSLIFVKMSDSYANLWSPTGMMKAQRDSRYRETKFLRAK